MCGNTVVSRAMIEWLKHGHPEDQVGVISMGVDLMHHLPQIPSIERSMYELLSLGACRKNGLSILLEAMPKLLPSFLACI
jgi:hypothetical protein